MAHGKLQNLQNSPSPVLVEEIFEKRLVKRHQRASTTGAKTRRTIRNLKSESSATCCVRSGKR